LRQKFTINNKKVEVGQNGEVREESFKVKTNGYPLLSGIVNKPVTVKQELTGSQLSGSAEEIIAALSRPGLKK
jgi:hypothetical protein